MSIKDYYYDSAFSSSGLIWSTFWGAQTFTPTDSYNIQGVILRMLKNGTPGTITLSIRATSAGKPVLPDLVSTTLDGTTIGTAYEWVTFEFASPLALTSGVKYAIVISNSTGSSTANYVRFAMDAAASSYAGGNKLHNAASGEDGASWQTVSGSDIIFVTADETMFLPAQATITSPTNADTITKLTTGLSWSESLLATSYDVWFGEAGSMILVSTGQVGLTFSVAGSLVSGTGYEWRIDSVNDVGTTEGVTWSFTTFTLATKIRMVSFIFSSTIAYKIEMGDQYMRFYYGDSVLLDENDAPVWITTPYLADDLFQIQVKQVGDVMWLVHKNYAPRKLSRTSATSFSLDVILFAGGPFLLRNDLIDPDTIFPATMSYASGVLTCDADIPAGSELLAFSDPGHIGALFKLTHQRVVKVVTLEGAGLSDPIDVKGTWRFVTMGTWEGTAIVQRNENGAGWDDFRTYTALKLGALQQSLALDESADNVQFRIYAKDGMSDDFSATFTVDDPYQHGIVRITSVISVTQAYADVVIPVASTEPTKRWAEGAWSAYRGFPSVITFRDERCIYGGEAAKPVQLKATEVIPE